MESWRVMVPDVFIDVKAASEEEAMKAALKKLTEDESAEILGRMIAWRQ